MSAPESSSPLQWLGNWVPIRSLSRRHRQRIGEHLLALTPSDRYLRFGHAIGDGQITRYAQTLDFERDELFGVFNRRLQVIAMAHLAYPRAGSSDWQDTAEFGVSVLPRARAAWAACISSASLSLAAASAASSARRCSASCAAASASASARRPASRASSASERPPCVWR